jgi:tetratricopeptide (TPR) repeat protein
MRTPNVPKAVFDEALGLIQAGELGAAESRCRAALRAYPRDINMEALLGALLVKMDRRTEAEALLREVIAAAPTFAKPAEDLGFLLVQSGRPADALPFLERATRLDPSLERAWFTLGKALALLGRGPEADAAFERCFERSPERRMMAHAAEHQKEGRIEEAEKLYRRVLRNNPRNVDALRLLALIASAADRPDDAERLLQEAIRPSSSRSSTSACFTRSRTGTRRRSPASTGPSRSIRPWSRRTSCARARSRAPRSRPKPPRATAAVSSCGRGTRARSSASAMY